jgi:hypothetical protein
MQYSQFGMNQQCIPSQSRDANVLTISHFCDVCLRPFLLLLLLAALVGVGSLPLSAQNSYGSVVGTISDAGGATIVGAKVTLTNQGTNAAVSARSGATGNFTLPNLNPGQYNIRVEFKGFKTYEQTAIDVQIGGTARVNVSLSIGDQTETVVVTAAPPPLQTDSASLGGVVEEKEILETPLNGRNVNNLLVLIPGVVGGGATSGNTVANQYGGAMTNPIAYGNYQIGGGMSGQSTFYVDGVPSNMPENNTNTLVPTQDAVQEFRVSTNSVSAEFGGFAGGVINIATKSGTNSFHGSAYEYVRNTVLDANDWFSNHYGESRNPLHQNQFGLNAGGPVIKNKTFFFFSWEREIVHSATPSVNTIPTAAELNGDFSAVATPIYDLYSTGTPQFACNGVKNVICSNRIDSSAQAILKATYPTPNQTGLVSNFVTSSRTSGDQSQYNARIDQHIGNSNTLFARYTYWDPSSGPNDPFGTKIGMAGTSSIVHEGAIGDTHTINATTVADVRLSFVHNEGFQHTYTMDRNISSFGPAYAALQTQFGTGVMPSISLSEYTSSNGNLWVDWFNNAFSFNGSITKILGRNTLKVGGNARQVNWLAHGYPGSDVNFTANASITANSNVANSGNSLASILLGIPSQTKNQQEGNTHSFLHNYGFFVTDTFQATSKLTFDMGLRWDQPGSYTERNDLNAVLLPNAASPFGTIVNPATGGNQTLVGNLALVNSAAYKPRRQQNLHWNLFDPRMGIAYRVSDKMVVRAGYGISHLSPMLSQMGPAISPINSSSTNLSNVAGATPTTTVSNPFPTGINLPGLRGVNSIAALQGQAISGAEPDQPYTYVQQWNLTVERTLGPNTSLSLAYAGSKGTHLLDAGAYTYSQRNLNQLPDKYFSMGAALMAPVANPFYGKIANGTLSGSTVLLGNMLQPYPQFQTVNEATPAEASSIYHALQGSFTQRFGSNGSLGLAYTWAKLISNTDSIASFLDVADGGLVGGIQDNNNLRNERSLSLQDFPMNLQISYSEALPFGAHQRYLKNAGKVITPIVSGWRVNGITTFRSGAPVSLLSAPNPLSIYFGTGTGTMSIRPNVAQNCHRQGSRKPVNGTITWFNTGCYSYPGDFALGNEGRTDSQLRADGIKNFDFSTTKETHLTEKMKLNFSAEFFNIFNRTQFAQPDPLMTSSTFGQETSQANNPRLMQFALRLAF